MTRRRFDMPQAGQASYADDLRHAIPMSRDTLFRCPEPEHCPRYNAKPQVNGMIAEVGDHAVGRSGQRLVNEVRHRTGADSAGRHRTKTVEMDLAGEREGPYKGHDLEPWTLLERDDGPQRRLGRSAGRRWRTAEGTAARLCDGSALPLRRLMAPGQEEGWTESLNALQRRSSSSPLRQPSAVARP